MFDNRKEFFLFWLIIFISLFLRLYKFDLYPINNNDDSLFHVWAGTSLYKNILKPTSLTIFVKDNPALKWYSQYNNNDVVRRFSFRIEQPYFDQPPLGMFFIALPARIFGYNDLTQIPQIIVRLPAIIASLFSLILTYILAKKLFDSKIALLSLATYGITPFFVFSQRQAYLENFLTPIFLLALINLINYLNKPNKKSFFILCLTSFISGLIKIVGFGVPLIIAFWFAKNRKLKPFLGILFVGVISLLSLFAYGYLINWQQFSFLQTSQGLRGMYLSSFFHIISSPEFYEPFADGIYILGFVAMLVYFLRPIKDQKEEFFALSFLFWLAIIILSSGTNNNSPWYRYPLFPFLSIATGYYLNLLLNYQNIFLLLPLLLLGFTGLDLLKISINLNFLRLFYVIAFAPVIIKYIFPKLSWARFLSKLMIINVLIAAAIINIMVTFKYLSVRCKINDCQLPDKIVIESEK